MFTEIQLAEYSAYLERCVRNTKGFWSPKTNDCLELRSDELGYQHEVTGYGYPNPAEIDFIHVYSLLGLSPEKQSQPAAEEDADFAKQIIQPENTDAYVPDQNVEFAAMAEEEVETQFSRKSSIPSKCQGDATLQTRLDVSTQATMGVVVAPVYRENDIPAFEVGNPIDLLKEFFVDFYCKNQINMSVNIPVVQMFIPLLIGERMQIVPMFLPPFDRSRPCARGAYRLKEKRPTQLTNKINCIVVKKLSQGSHQANADAFQLTETEAENAFKSGDLQVEAKKAVLKSKKLFESLFNESFFKGLLKVLNDNTENDIQVNILSKLTRFASHSEKVLKEFIQTFSKDDTQTPLRQFKKPFTFQENILAIITYLKDFIYQFKVMTKYEKFSNESTFENMKEKHKEQFGTLLTLLNQYQTMLVEKELVAEEDSYPTDKKRNTKGPKDLDFQSFVWESAIQTQA